mmetsp:Transcript_21103/g.38313  ORF Transcript_21103/g.38313 Transcript_21103/m.38313 type:complete len:352 (+) Transcript_21103:213-1268(+)|eukprot:CAMPEP_0196130324 /NCGR_PEP_ID=MMETSP0910-20130528/744_1 /TAXON_ID=49265 /ORGANISM="Thalassiosira rotula, Strain GSO102" /LENGTH=351 /DNA_ID=CAMNT_0041389615 /DNA_START=213 /DNA_END=1268 /DNA_ORIENTATION=+
MSSSTMPYPREEDFVEISERLKVMRKQEASHYAVPDYLAAEWQQRLRDATSEGSEDGDVERDAIATTEDGGLRSQGANSAEGGNADPVSSSSAAGSASSSSSQITEVWREKICEWCYQVVDHFDFNREVVSVAMSYLDRYLATRTVNRRIFQLAAMTALYLAIKLYEPGKLRMSSLIDLSRGYFLAEHIVTMEDSMLQSLHWHVHPPTPFAFCRDLATLISRELPASAHHDVGELSRFMTELSVCDYWFVTKKPSSVALASIVNAIELQGHGRVDPRYKVEFLHRVVDVGMDIANDGEIIECYERLREMYLAGGYQANVDESEGRVDTGSPTGVGAGPEAEPQELEGMECA